MAINVLQLQEVGDYEAQSCLSAQLYKTYLDKNYKRLGCYSKVFCEYLQLQRRARF